MRIIYMTLFMHS